MKKMLLKLSDSLLSREQMKGIKGGDYGGGGSGGGTSCGYYTIYCQVNGTSYGTPTNGGCCPNYSTGTFICKVKYGQSAIFSQCI
jgi:hypothetical protein